MNANSNSIPAPSAVLPLAIVTIPLQPWVQPYDHSKALKQGTIFPNLDLPFFAGGEAHE